jgi:hypothetical protein
MLAVFNAHKTQQVWMARMMSKCLENAAGAPGLEREALDQESTALMVTRRERHLSQWPRFHPATILVLLAFNGLVQCRGRRQPRLSRLDQGQKP